MRGFWSGAALRAACATIACTFVASALALSAASRAESAELVRSSAPLPARESLDEVVVTVRKSGERAGDVPLALQSIDASQVGVGGVDGLAALAARVPGLAFESQWGGLNSAPVLRGQSQPSLAGDNVGVFVDGVFQASRTALDIDPLDVQRIDVVRGPQSALFGQNTFAGAIHYVSHDPTSTPRSGFRLDAGSDALRGAEGFLSGPLDDAGLWRVRAAAAWRRQDGTHENVASGAALGGSERRGAVLTLARGEDLVHGGDLVPGWALRASVRWGSSRLAHPPVASIEPLDYDCGARDVASGLWSYRCGDWPIARTASISPGIPESEQEVLQARVRLAATLGPVRLTSESSFYRAETSAYRDFDSSASGLALGVCRIGLSCAPALGSPRLIDRAVEVNVVQQVDGDVRQWSQELRAAGTVARRAQWMLGGVAYGTAQRFSTFFGADGRGLAAGEQWTALLAATPEQLGPVSQFSRARVDGDPNELRIHSALNYTRNFSAAVFGSLDYSPDDRLQLRAEARMSWERERIDSRISNFGPGLGRTIPEQRFRDFTPRASAMWRIAPQWRGWTSAAKGSRSGGTNTTVGLEPDEQQFRPESNWTYELGLRRVLSDGGTPRAQSGGRVAPRLRGFEATLFYVDWRNTQIIGFATTPGIGTLLTRNTAGITTRGIELAAEVELSEALSLWLAWSGVDPRYRAGSEDIGSRGFCGLSATSSTSSFCRLGPSRTPGLVTPQLVPYIDGNSPQRVPRTSAAASLIARLPWRPADWQLGLRADVGTQGDQFERSIEGAHFGARTTVDARLSATRGPWSLELWGRNLSDERWIRGAASRGAQFYPTTPRPYDTLLAEGRRFGLTVRHRPEP